MWEIPILRDTLPMTHTDASEPMRDFTVEIGERGRIVLPAAIRRQLGLAEGDELIVSVLPDKTIRLTSRKTVAANFRGAYKRLSATKSLVDELIADRRKEAKNE
jgi:AbrB family looped-hinge helix DNA binding protein